MSSWLIYSSSWLVLKPRCVSSCLWRSNVKIWVRDSFIRVRDLFLNHDSWAAACDAQAGAFFILFHAFFEYSVFNTHVYLFLNHFTYVTMLSYVFSLHVPIWNTCTHIYKACLCFQFTYVTMLSYVFSSHVPICNTCKNTYKACLYIQFTYVTKLTYVFSLHVPICITCKLLYTACLYFQSCG